MRFIPTDSEYNALMLTLDREQAEALRVKSRELRREAAELIVGSRRLRRTVKAWRGPRQDSATIQSDLNGDCQ